MSRGTSCSWWKAIRPAARRRRRATAALQGRSPGAGQGKRGKRRRSAHLLPRRRRAGGGARRAEEGEGEGRRVGDLALQGPGRDEPRAAVGDDDEPRLAASGQDGFRPEGDQESARDLRAADGLGRGRRQEELDEAALEDGGGRYLNQGQTTFSRRQQWRREKGPGESRRGNGRTGATCCGSAKRGSAESRSRTGDAIRGRPRAAPALSTISPRPSRPLKLRSRRPTSSWIFSGR